MAFEAKMNALATVLVIGWLAFYGFVQCVPDTTVQSIACDGGSFNSTDPLATSLAFVLNDLQTVTPKSKNFNHFAQSPSNSSALFGHASCNKTLTPAFCADCLKEAAKTIQKSCAGYTIALTTLKDCEIEYQTAKFNE